MTPTVALLSLTTDVIMQIQMAGLLGRVPCAASALVNITCSEMELFRACTDSPEVDTPCVSITELASGTTASEAASASVIVTFVKAAAARGDTLLPYYSLQRLARELFKVGEELTAATLNGCTSRFRTLLNAFRAQQFPATEPLFQCWIVCTNPIRYAFIFWDASANGIFGSLISGNPLRDPFKSR